MATETITPTRYQAESETESNGVHGKPLEDLSEEERRQLLWDRMLAAGLIRERPSPRTPQAERPPLMRVEGKPLSETIIEERR